MPTKPEISGKTHGHMAQTVPQCDVLFDCLISGHLASSIPSDLTGDTKLAKIHETLVHYRDKATAAASTSGGPDAATTTASLLAFFREKPVEAVALDMLLHMVMGRSPPAADGGAAPPPLAWLCDEETRRMALHIVDTVWPPDSQDQVGCCFK